MGVTMEKLSHEFNNEFEQVVALPGVLNTLLDESPTSLVISMLTNRICQSYASIEILMNNKLYEDGGVLTRVLYEATLRLTNILVDPEKAPTEAAFYATKGNTYRSKVLSDVRELKLDANIVKIEHDIKQETDGILNSFNLTEAEVDGLFSIDGIAKKLGEGIRQSHRVDWRLLRRKSRREPL